MSLAKHMIFSSRSKSPDRKNLVSISSIVRDLEVVIQKFVELAGASEAVVQKCYVKIRRTCKETPKMESLF